MRYWLLALVLLFIGAPSVASAQCPPGNLLANKAASGTFQVGDAKRMTDEVAPGEGDHWRTNQTAVFNGTKAHATWDLGAETHLTAMLLQGDNNDAYEVLGSSDGKTFTVIWTAKHHANPGMRMRDTKALDATVRYLRIGGATGDNAYSIGEFQAFCQAPAVWPAEISRKDGVQKGTKKNRKSRMAQGKIMLGALGMLAFIGLFLARRDEDPMLALILPVMGCSALLYTAWLTLTEAERRTSAADVLVWEKRALFIAIGFVALVAIGVLVQALRSRSFRLLAERGGLIALMLAGGLTWINFGTFHGTRVVHYWDSFHYYMGAKYFKETRYTNLYQCSAIGEVDDGRKAEFKKRKIRDLRDNTLLPAMPQLERDQECRAAFTPERWAAFRQDLRLFRSHMGTSWWGKMFKDHGYNATPVWNMVGSGLTNLSWNVGIPPEGRTTSPADTRTLSKADRVEVKKHFNEVERPAFEARLYKLVALDFALYAGIFIMLGWAFGLRIMALAMLVWGAGYPWAYFWTGGGFGRVPWLFMATAGLAFVKKGHPILGGFSLTWSALLRVFPGGLVFGITLKIIWDFFSKRKNAPEVQAAQGAPRKLLARISKTHWRFIAGCTLAVATLVPASLPSADGFAAYPEFIANSMKHKATPLTNHMGLPTLLAYHPKRTSRYTKNSKLEDPFGVWKSERKRTLKERRLIHVGLLLMFAALIMYTSRRLEDWAVTSLSVLFMIGIFELTCYYYNFVVLLAPFAMKKMRYTVVYIGMAIATHVAMFKWPRYDEQYTWETLIVLAAVLYMLLDTAWDQFREDRAAKRGTPPASTPAEPLPEDPQPA
jgi:hypothetical protein